MIAAMPLLMIAVAILAGSGAALTEKEANAYGRAGAIGKICRCPKMNFG